MTAQRLAGHCGTCQTPLRPENRTGVCAECRYYERDRKLRAIEEAQERRQRAALVAERLKNLGATSVQETQQEGTP